MKKSRLALIAGTAVLALFLASCGKYGTASSTSSSKVKTVQIVGPSASQPYQIYKSKDKLSGYNGDILAAIQKDLKNKYKFQYQVTEANSVFVGLQSGKYDLAVGNYYYSTERAKTYDYSRNPTLLSDLRLVVRKDDNKITDLASLAKTNGKLEPIDVADPRYGIVENWNKQHPEQKVTLKSSGFVDTANQFKDIVNKQYDAILYPRTNFDTAQKKLNEPLKLSKSISVFPVVYYYHKSSTSTQLRKDIDKELLKLRKNGTLAKLSQKWLGSDPFTAKNDRVTDVTKSYAQEK